MSLAMKSMIVIILFCGVANGANRASLDISFKGQFDGGTTPLEENLNLDSEWLCFTPDSASGAYKTNKVAFQKTTDGIKTNAFDHLAAAQNNPKSLETINNALVYNLEGLAILAVRTYAHEKGPRLAIEGSTQHGVVEGKASEIVDGAIVSYYSTCIPMQEAATLF